MSLWLVFLLGRAFLAWSQQAPEHDSTLRKTEKIYIEVKDPSIHVIPCAVPMLAQKENETLEKIRSKLVDDLTFSGLFQPMPNPPPLNPAEITGTFRYAWWKDIGADLVITADVEETPKGKGIRFYAFDTILNAKISERKSTEPWEDATNDFLDRLVERLSGKPGIFQTRIAFVAKAGAAKEIFMMDWDGRNARALTGNGSLNLAPSWDADGRRLLFTSYIRQNPDLYTYEINPGTLEVLSSFPGLNYGAEMSPDGNRIAVTITKAKNSDIYILDIRETSTRRLTDHPAIDSSPTWDPAGQRIAFVSDRSGTPQIYLMDLEGESEAQRLTFGTTHNDYPAWSPAGGLIAYSGLAPEGKFHIYVVSTDGWVHRKITKSRANHEFPTWAPDGRHLAYTSDLHGKDRLVLILRDVPTGEEREIQPSVKLTGWPAWSPFLSH